MFIVAIAIMSAIVMLIWNLLIPDLFHGPEVNYWQAVGLLVLTRLLVGIRGRHGHWGPWSWKHRRRGWKHRWYDGNGCRDWEQSSSNDPARSQEEWQAVKNRWKAEFGNRMHDKWMQWESMSPEERRAFKEERRNAYRSCRSEYRRGGRSADKHEDREDPIGSAPRNQEV